MKDPRQLQKEFLKRLRHKKMARKTRQQQRGK